MVGPREQALQSLWQGTCDVIVQEQHKDPNTKRMVKEERKLYTGVPCRLSFETVAAAGASGHAAGISQEVKLFLGREIRVPEGSKLVVTQNGTTTAYRQSGPPAVYSHHQEIRLELAESWA